MGKIRIKRDWNLEVSVHKRNHDEAEEYFGIGKFTEVTFPWEDLSTVDAPSCEANSKSLKNWQGKI